MSIARSALFVMLMFTGASVGVPLTAYAQTSESQDQTTESTLLLLKSSLKAWPDGRQHQMLNVIGQSKDPRLKPIYDYLFEMPQPQMKAHGLLGLAEIDENQRLDLAKLATIDNAAIQTEIIGALMGSDRLSDDQAQEIYAWEKIDPGVRLLLAIQLIAHDKKPDMAPIRPISEKSVNFPQQMLAHYALFLSGEKASLAPLEEMITAQDPRRDGVMYLILNSAIKYKVSAIGPWALKAIETQMALPKEKRNQRLLVSAMNMAILLDVPGIQAVVTKMYETSADDLPARVRIALVTLNTYQHLTPDYFNLLAKSDDDIIKVVGETALALKSGENTQQALDKLVNFNHPQMDEWVLSWVLQKPTPKQTVPTLMALINRVGRAFSDTSLDSNIRTAEQFDFATGAAQAAIELSPDEAIPQIQALLKSDQTPLQLKRAIYMGLIQARSDEVVKLMQDLPMDTDPRVRSLRLVLMVKHKVKLTPDQMEHLAVFIQGGGQQTPTLRLLAGLGYIDQIGKFDHVINKAVGN